MHPPRVADLPSPPPGRTGWPWTREARRLPERMEDGSPWPTITIVTPSYNQRPYVEETIRSILLQGYPALEYMVIDGGSTDGTPELVERYAPFLNTWISERDRGQSHALIKGFTRATGALMNWINSDDLLMPGALEAVARAWRAAPGSLVAGPVIRFEHATGAEELHRQYGLSFENIVCRWRHRCEFQQPGLFFPRALYEEVGGVDEGLHYSMDYDLFCRMLARGGVTYVEQPLARFRYHSGSKTGSNEESFIREGLRVSRRYWGTWLPQAERRAAEREAARRLARQATRRLVGGQVSRSVTLYREAAMHNPVATLFEPLQMTAHFVQRRLKV